MGKKRSNAVSMVTGAHPDVTGRRRMTEKAEEDTKMRTVGMISDEAVVASRMKLKRIRSRRVRVEKAQDQGGTTMRVQNIVLKELVEIPLEIVNMLTKKKASRMR